MFSLPGSDRSNLSQNRFILAIFCITLSKFSASEFKFASIVFIFYFTSVPNVHFLQIRCVTAFNFLYLRFIMRSTDHTF
jgi:hypothetical protein